ncbi:ABC transporter permease [Kitasatospora kifunensis]|uniref:Transport permease protein n=1 Tax=Kitasatospora kifunensis TaxID=58351 RepID=A0A7W7R3W6_KITKI|nr:ABC transporter permease [Kitasatospora kifunensis]MBB4924713.1 ABC-2 type transport system permease protein [Kitasatospora kifunensis]
MSTRTHTLTDTATMLRRNLRHTLRYPAMTVGSVFGPVIMLLLFVGILGKTLGAGLAATGGHHTGGYIGYIAPGIIITAVASGSMATAVAVCVDMTEGIVDRFRTMPIARVSILAAHVINSMITTVVSTASVIAVAMALGFRPSAGLADWAAAAGLLLLLTFALTWLAVAIGLVSETPEAASNSPMLIVFLPFIGSAFAPAGSMPPVVRQFAEYQPFTPAIETIRGLLTGTPTGHNPVIAIAWCVVIATGGYLWARAGFNRAR